MSQEIDAATRAHFAARAATYAGGDDESLRAMLELADPRPGERALDVATGTGLVLFQLAAAVGPAGLAAGVDFTPAMLDQAASRRAEVDEQRAPAEARPALLAADAARLPFSPERFDVVTCRFSVHHMADPAACLAAMAAVLRPGGRLVIADFVRPDDAAEAERHDRLERLRGHVYVQIYERARLEEMMADAGCPAAVVRLTERSAAPYDWLSSPNVAPEDRAPLEALIDDIREQGSGAGFEVRTENDAPHFVRADAVLLGVKRQHRRV